jgi:hypothetical protein
VNEPHRHDPSFLPSFISDEREEEENKKKNLGNSTRETYRIKRDPLPEEKEEKKY